MSLKVKCNFCLGKIEVEGAATLPPHETSKGSGERCDGSGLPVESMDPSVEPQESVVTDGGNGGKS